MQARAYATAHTPTERTLLESSREGMVTSQCERGTPLDTPMECALRKGNRDETVMSQCERGRMPPVDTPTERVLLESSRDGMVVSQGVWRRSTRRRSARWSRAAAEMVMSH